MSLLRIDPFSGFDRMTRKMSDLSKGFENGFTIEKGGFNPRVDITEDENYINVHVELAGLSKNDVKISVDEDNTLSISGERSDKREIEDKTFHRKEISFGSFKRAFILPDYANRDSIKAKFDHGVLEIAIGKIEPEKPKVVDVEIK